MARNRALFDMMQSYPFWVFDASGFSGNLLFSVFDPVLGFSAAGAPEISVETQEIQPGNWEFKKRAVKTASVGVITLRRGARFYDSDFYNWITAAIRGFQPVRRNLVLVQFLGFRPVKQLIGQPAGSSGFGTEIAALSLAERLPGRAWVLHDCLPVRYKPGDDFDATSGAVSIQELDVQPEHISELTLATVSPVAARAFSLGLSIANAAGAF
jgi:phage tail-like protein